MSLGAGIAIGMAAAQNSNEEKQAYTDMEVSGWEFKILQTCTNSFKSDQDLKKVLEEESLAGWELIEKLDDHRIRLKRSVKDRGKGGGEIDAYRSVYGISPLTIFSLMLLFGVCFFSTIFFIVLFLILSLLFGIGL